MPSARQIADFNSAYAQLRSNIFAFCKALRFAPTYQQCGLLQAVQDARFGVGSNRITVRSGQGPGKTTVSCIAAAWRVFCDHQALGIVTAPTMRQCQRVWLAEFRKLIQRAHPAIRSKIEVTDSRVICFGQKDWGIQLATATKDVNAQGYHNPNLFIIVEEASGVSREIITQYKNTLSNHPQGALLLLIGNPNTRDSEFFDSFYGFDNSRWKKLHFNAEDTAKYYPNIVHPDRNKDTENEFGRDSDVYRVRVLGEFPLTDPNCVFSMEELMDCCGDDGDLLRCASSDRPLDGGIAKQIATDFARFGGDESVNMRRRGEAIVETQRFPHQEPTETARLAMAMQARAGWNNKETLYVPDVAGMGQGVVGLFYEAGKNVFEWSSHNTSAVSPQYKQRDAEAWFSLRSKVRYHRVCGGLPRVHLPKDQMLLTQLATRLYFTDAKGKLVLEKKDDYVARGHESPDRADCATQVMSDAPCNHSRCSLLGGSG